MIRGEVGLGDEGKIFTMALSPDGRTLAAGGWMKIPGEDGHVIRLHDFQTGALVALLKGHNNVVNSVAFSRDGRRLISGSSDAIAMLWEVPARGVAVAAQPAGGEKPVIVQPALKLQGHTAQIYTVAFLPDGQRAVTGGNDTTVRLWDTADGHQTAKLEGHKDHVRSISIASDGTIASGSRDTEIRLWDGATGQLKRTLTTPSVGIGKVVFSPDGRRLLATSGTVSGQDTGTVWDTSTWSPLASYQVHRNIVLAVAISPDGRLAATGGGSNQEIHVWELETGKRPQGPGGTPLSLQGGGAPGWAAGFSADGTRIAWGHTFGRAKGGTGHSSETGSPLEFMLRLPRDGARDGEGLGHPERVTPVAADAAGAAAVSPVESWLRARPSAGGIALSHRKGGGYGYDALLDVRRAGTLLATLERGSTDGFRYASYTFTPDNRTIVSGGANGQLQSYDLDAVIAAAKGGTLIDSALEKVTRKFQGHEGDVWAVTPSADGKYLVSGSGDQTIRLWNLATRELIVSLFHATAPGGEPGEWVMWTPQGYYTGSPGADNLIGWQLNKGSDKSAGYVTAAQLREQFNRPDIVDKAIVLASATQAIATSNGTAFKLADLLARPVPALRITAPADQATVSGGSAQLKVALGKTPDPIKSISVRVNGTLIRNEPLDAAAAAKGELVVPVPLAKGANTVIVTATNATGESNPDQGGTLTLTHDGEGALDKRGTLRILAIGVDKYPQAQSRYRDLSYSARDATSFADALVKTLGPQHAGKADVQLLVNVLGQQQPTARNIRRALRTLRDEAKENDTTIVFVAGHGELDRSDYLFLPTDANLAGTGAKGWDGDSIIQWVDIESAVFGAKGRRFLFVDTCHSAGAYNGRLGNNAYHNDVVAFTATGQDQQALELHKLKHGVFTYALVEGLTKGEADTDKTHLITVDKLGVYLKKKARELITAHYPNYTGVWPIPEMHKARDAGNHVLVRM